MKKIIKFIFVTALLLFAVYFSIPIGKLEIVAWGVLAIFALVGHNDLISQPKKLKEEKE